MRLLFDIGNQITKWCTSEQLKQLDDPSIKAGLMQQRVKSHIDTVISCLAQIDYSKVDSVWVSSVVDQTITNELVDFFRLHVHIDCSMVKPAPSFGNLTNKYDNPAYLGVDRWLAAIAANSLYPGEAVVVVDAGTALTIDYIDHNETYCGGIIVPGLKLMMDSLADQTCGIEEYWQNSSGVIGHYIATNTEDAVLQGARLAMAGAIEKVFNECNNGVSPNSKIIMTGGDAVWLKELIRGELIVDSFLVQKGLDKVAQRGQ